MKQITAAERRETFTKGLKPIAHPSATNPAPLSAPSTAASSETPTEASQASKSPPSGRARLKCQWEPPSLIAREIDSLSKRWAAEINQPPFEPDWNRIFELERSDAAMVWTARTPQGALAGYLALTFTRGMFINAKFARVEAGYLAPEWREGLTGYRYIKSLLAAIDAVGKFNVEWETNDVYEPDEHGRSRFAKVLERLNFVQVGAIMRRR